MAPRANNPDGTIAFSQLRPPVPGSPDHGEELWYLMPSESVVIESLTLGYVLVLSQARVHFRVLSSGVSGSANDRFVDRSCLS